MLGSPAANSIYTKHQSNILRQSWPAHVSYDGYAWAESLSGGSRKAALTLCKVFEKALITEPCGKFRMHLAVLNGALQLPSTITLRSAGRIVIYMCASVLIRGPFITLFSASPRHCVVHLLLVLLHSV